VAIVFLEGFDKYGGVNSNNAGVQALLTAGDWTSVTGGGTFTIAAPLSVTGFAVFISSLVNLNKTLTGNYARLIGGMRFSATLGNVCGIQFNDGGSAQASIVINSAGQFLVRNAAYSSGTILGTSVATISANTTHYLEWDITFANAGSYQLWLDGVSILTGSGDTTATANAFANSLALAVQTSTALTIDDFYLFDTTGSINNAVLLTSPRVETAFPISDSAVQFAFGAGILGSSVARTGAVSGPAANSLTLRRFTPAVACTVNSITIVPATSNGSTQYRGVVYTDSGGVAGTLMSSGTTVVGAVAGTPLTLPLTTPQALSAGTPYWLGLMNDLSAVNLQQLDGLASASRATVTFSSGAPGTAPAMSVGQITFLLWGNLTGITGANYDEVNNQPPEGQYSYVFEATVGEEDLYNFLPVTAPIVHAVAVKASLAKSDSGAKTASMRLKSGTTNSAGSVASVAPGTTYGWGATYFSTDPDTGVAWTPTGLNAAQAGVRVAS
jgi:hypothetical protein